MTKPYEDIEPEYILKAVTLPATQLRPGDVIVSTLETIHSVTMGPKRVSLFNEQGNKIGYVLLGSAIEVTRKVETEESRQKRDYIWTNNYIAGLIQRTEDRFNKALDELNAEAAKGDVSFWVVEKLIEMNAEKLLWDRVKKHAEGDRDHIAALFLAVEEAREAVLSSRGTSVSTSGTSNLMEAERISRLGRFIQEAEMTLCEYRDE